MIAPRLRTARWRVASIAAVLVVAAGVTLLIVRPWESTEGQRVDVVAGGGTSNASSGSATSLRLPPVGPMTVEQGGTLWAAGIADDSPQLIRVTPRHRAMIYDLRTLGDDQIVSLDTAPDGSVWVLAGNGADTAYRFTGGALHPAFAAFSATRAFPPDGSVVSSASPQPDMQRLAFDPDGRLEFLGTGSTVHCLVLRRIGSDGRITTLAGRHDSGAGDAEPNDAPANGSDARRLCLAFNDTFAPLGNDAVLVQTKVATFVVDLRTGRTGSLTSVSDNSPSVPPLGSGPRRGSADITSLYVPQGGLLANRPCATSANTWYTVNVRSSKVDNDNDGAPNAVAFPAGYDWLPRHGPKVAARPGHGDAQVLLGVDHGRTELLSGIASTMTCSPNALYVSARVDNGKHSVIAEVPVR